MRDAPPNSSVPQLSPAEFLETYFIDLEKKCRKKYGIQGEEACSMAIETILSRARRGRIKFCTWWYFMRTAAAAFRAIICRRKVECSFDELVAAGFDVAAPAEKTLDERLEILRDDPRFRDAIEAILSGVNITKAVASYGKFIREARIAVEQPRLF